MLSTHRICFGKEINLEIAMCTSPRTYYNHNVKLSLVLPLVDRKAVCMGCHGSKGTTEAVARH